eukprot:6234406-Prymnesium_polylepis.1
MASCPAAVATVLSAAIPRRVRIEFIADVVCPWCYIGLKRLESAAQLAAAEGIAADVTYTPFILRRHLPKSGIDKLQMFSQSMGEANARAKFAQIQAAALADGLCLDFVAQRAGNSEDAHRLLTWASTRSHADEAPWLTLMREMFHQYNCKRGWLGSSETLLSAVENAGTLPVNEAATVLESETAYVAELDSGLE